MTADAEDRDGTGERSAKPTRLILASASPRRLALLAQIGIVPALTAPANIDELPQPTELPRALARRLARGKAERAAEYAAEPGTLILAADTVVGVGRRIVPKPADEEEARACLALLSGRAHRVYTGLCVAVAGRGFRERLVETRVRFKRLAMVEVEAYVQSGEWRGKAGGYAIQGLAAAFVIGLVGSYSNVVGLPLYETCALLEGQGYPVRAGWGRSAEADR